MSVGEKIQYYRKKCGFSQEELGQKLLVSRQTVSLWEMDKTLPTVDNLVRLKEIFGVSVDELLNIVQTPMEKDLAENSVAQVSQDSAKEKPPVCSAKGQWKVGSVLLFIFSIFSPLFAFVTLGFASNFPEDYYWAFFVYMLIPIGSIVYGILLKKKGYGGKKNVIAGGVIAGVLCLFGLLFLAMALTYSNSDQLLIKAEQTIGIDIPEYRSIRSEDGVYDNEDWRKTAVSRCFVYFGDEQVIEFEKEITADGRWITSVPTRLVGIVPSAYNSDYEYVLICNADTKELNTLPQESGEYSFIGLFYDEEDNEMEIVEYLVEYVA